jgi:large subunit ribosomal protein L15
LGHGEITRPLAIKTHRVSDTARQKIEAAGGTIELLPL